MDRNLPLLTIIIPVYNTEKYLERCVESVRNQTYDNLEIILIDDGSTDASGGICDRLAEEDGRIVVLHKKNGGQSSARNMGLDIATGELIGFVDSDDYIVPDMYETLYNLMNEYEAEISCCNFEKRGLKGHEEYNSDVLDEVSVFSREESLKTLLECKRIAYVVWNKLYKRKTFGIHTDF